MSGEGQGAEVRVQHDSRTVISVQEESPSNANIGFLKSRIRRSSLQSALGGEALECVLFYQRLRSEHLDFPHRVTIIVGGGAEHDEGTHTHLTRGWFNKEFWSLHTEDSNCEKHFSADRDRQLLYKRTDPLKDQNHFARAMS